MNINYIPLKFTPKIEALFFRELCGIDEEAIGDAGLLSTISFLDKLIVDKNCKPLELGVVKKLVTADRDRLLVLIYTSLYGDKIESTLTCNKCDAPFDLNFSLKGLVQHLDEQIDLEDIQQQDKAYYQLPDGIQFRLPTGEDEYQLFGLSRGDAANKLLKNCILTKGKEADLSELQKAMEKVAPMVSTKLAAVCVECNHQQEVHFDIQTYLMTALKKEQPLLSKEVHRIAKAYGWGLKEILSLTRKQRRNYYALINSEPNLS